MSQNKSSNFSKIIKVEVIKSFDDVKAGSVVDAIKIGEDSYKVFHATGWYAFPHDYIKELDYCKKK